MFTDLLHFSNSIHLLLLPEIFQKQQIKSKKQFKKMEKNKQSKELHRKNVFQTLIIIFSWLLLFQRHDCYVR